MPRKRWKLISLWSAAVVLAIVAAGAYVDQAARAAVEESVQSVFGFAPGARIEPDISFWRARLSSESWLILEFKVDLEPEYNDSLLNNTIYTWRLRQWDRADPFALPEPTPDDDPFFVPE